MRDKQVVDHQDQDDIKQDGCHGFTPQRLQTMSNAADSAADRAADSAAAEA